MKEIFFAIASALIITSCGNNAEHQHVETATEQKSTVHKQETKQAKNVSLNNGEKWKANPATTEGIQKMLGLVKSVPATASVDEFQSLQKALDTEFNTVLQKCTMTGEAHNQLHNYLLPLRELIKQLGNSDTASSQKALGELQQYLSEYQLYFE